jgi:uncharacterized membrane protein
MSDDKNPSIDAPSSRRASDTSGVELETSSLRRTSHQFRIVPSEFKPRVYSSRTLLIADVLVFFLTTGNVHGAVRIILGLTLGVAIPGWSLVGLLKLQKASLEIALSLAVSLSLLMVTAEVLMSLHLWHLVALEEVTSLVCLPSLLWQSLTHPMRKGAK